MTVVSASNGKDICVAMETVDKLSVGALTVQLFVMARAHSVKQMSFNCIQTFLLVLATKCQPLF